MQIENVTLTTDNQPFHLTATWLDQISDLGTPVDYPLMIICPGGGFTYHSGREEAPIATRFNASGMHTIVLNYQLEAPETPVYPRALHQVAATLDWVSDQAAAHHVDTDRIVLAGFSAGGNVAALFNVVATDPQLREQYGLNAYRGRHAAVVLSYPVIDLRAGFPTTQAERIKVTSDQQLWAAQALVTAATRPAFVWQTRTDELVPAQNSLLYVQALMAKGVAVEYHLFGNGVHGLALADHVTAKPGKPKYLNAEARQWPHLATRWLQTQGILTTD